MKNLHKHILLFLLPIVIAIVLLPVSKRAKYVALKENCFYTGLWIHDRLNIIETPIDIAFVGSSHTLNGINDRLLDSLLGESVNVSNLGFCKLGRDLNYSIVKQLIETKSPKRIILEVREGENAESHKDFPLMAETSDVIQSPFGRSYIPNVYTHYAYNLEVFQGELFGKIEQDRFWHNHGFTNFDDTLSEGAIKAAQKMNQFSMSKIHSWRYRRFRMHFPKSYINKIAALCMENNIELSFIYMPMYITKSKPKHFEYYQTMGKVWLPPKEILRDRNNWYDAEHFNTNGANKLAEWLSKELKEEK